MMFGLRLPHLQKSRRLESRVLKFQLHEIMLETEAGEIKEQVRSKVTEGMLDNIWLQEMKIYLFGIVSC